LLKDRNCGEITKNDVNTNVTLAGWVHRRRDHGNLIFIDLRDREGVVQVVFNSEISQEAHKIAESLRNEWVVQVKGNVALRNDNAFNKDLSTGEIEIYATHLTVLNEALTPPFYVNEETDVDENIRLKYRYIDLRREGMKNALIIRHKIVKYIRDFLDPKGFLEIETPILIKSTPEGARDHIVPSRLYPGNFYALPQSPQQLKQLLMVAGIEKYFQIARCFRDEDSRADRQPEFTQLDLEMSFVSEEDVLSLTQDLFVGMMQDLFPDKKFPTEFPRFTYQEVIKLYGTDKPDLRFGLEMEDYSDISSEIDFQVFKNVLASQGIVKGFKVNNAVGLPRRELDRLTDLVKTRGANGLVTIGISSEYDNKSKITMNDIKSNISKFLTIEQVTGFIDKSTCEPGDMLFIIAGPSKITNASLALLREEIGSKFDLIDKNEMAFAFVTDFPLFQWDDGNLKWQAMHHAFCMPKEGHQDYLHSDPGKVIAQSYDLVCNGLEMASGSIRVHQRGLQEEIFNVLGYSKEDVSNRFAQLLDAFEYGAPPHGGIAPGIDRLVMVLLGKETIRDVMAFPKTQSQMDPLFGAPSPIEKNQLEELHIGLLD